MKTRTPVIAAVVIAALASTPALRAAGDEAAGKAFYTSKCQTCHGAKGEGKESIAKLMKVEMRHLGAGEVQGRPEADFVKIMTAGTGKMKPISGITEKAAQDVVAYLRTLAKK